MLAKYVPGGVWTPAARVIALRRFGVKDTPVVLATILLEAGLSAIAGVGVFAVGLAFVGGVDAPLLPLAAFAVVVTILLWPSVFRAVATRLLRPFGAEDVAPLNSRTVFQLLAFYALTWPLGGLALFFLIRSVGGDPALSTIPFLGGASAVGAIVGEGVALGAIVLNRLAITLVEAVLLLVGLVMLRRVPRASEPEPEHERERSELVAQSN